MTIFYKDALHFYVEVLKPHGAKVMSFQVASGGQHYFIVGCYLAPAGAVTIKRVVTAIGQSPFEAALLVAGDLNTNLATMEGSNCGEDIVAAVVTAWLEDMYAHFLPRCKPLVRKGMMWCM